jgi:paraquat-inducible protein A
VDPSVQCSSCGLPQRLGALPPGGIAKCCRCGATIARNPRASRNTSLALTLAALIFYVPANIYPIMRLTFYGAYSESNIWDGCVSLFRAGQWPVAVVVFLASILVPLLKLLGLLYLTATRGQSALDARRQRAWIHRCIERIGPWAMLDVFIMAILVASVKLGQFVTVLPGRGLVAFTALVVLTILASASFDPHSIWEPAKVTT